jgi:hypothetical protein
MRGKTKVNYDLKIWKFVSEFTQVIIGSDGSSIRPLLGNEQA